MRIAHVASEIQPFAKTGGLADVAAALPRALAARGHHVVAVTPLHRPDPGAEPPGEAVGPTLAVGDVSFRVRRAELGGVAHLLLDAPRLFARPAPYGTGDGDYPDNAVRFTAFARAAVAAVARELPDVDLIHAHDWQAALVPVLLGRDPLLERAAVHAPTVLTVHNLAYQGSFEPWVLEAARLPRELFRPDLLEFFGRVSFLKAGLLASDRLTTVSPRYAEEILTPELGCGLHEVLRARRDDLRGVLNGIDVDTWDPAADPELPRPYDADTAVGGKAAARTSVAEATGLERTDRPLAAMVSRLVHQKGVDLVAEAADEVVRAGAQLLVLGSGDPELEDELRRCADRHSGEMAVVVGYDEALAHRIYAAADLLLMPSRFEPCGLSQMIAFRYGTLPVVYPTGGLSDTVRDVDLDPERGNGFRMENLSPTALVDAVRRALDVLSDPGRGDELRRRIMSEDHGWAASATAYEALYAELVNRP